jgi:phosphate/sulfate permease
MAKTAHGDLPVSTRPLLIGAAIFFGALAAAAGFLWFWFGTKVFFDMVAAGIAYCF